MVNEEELEILKIIGETTKPKNLWLKVYDDEKKKEGLISVFDIFKVIMGGVESKDVPSTKVAPKHKGITIKDVKIVGLCSKCREKDDEILKYNNGRIIPDEDISCINNAFGKCEDSTKSAPNYKDAIELIDNWFVGRGDMEKWEWVDLKKGMQRHDDIKFLNQDDCEHKEKVK